MAARSGNRGNRKASLTGTAGRNLPETVAVAVEAQSHTMNDLVSELREISGQVNRMMSQVERGIDRLGAHTHAAEPLKR